MDTRTSWLRACVLGLLLLLCLMAVPGWSAQTTEWAVGTTQTVLSTELNSLTSTAYTAASAAIDNRIGQTGNGYIRCRLEISATFGSAPTGQPGVSLWFTKNTDTTTATYETTPTASIGIGAADVVIPVITGQTGTRRSVDTWCPAERFKITLQNNSGQSMAASGNTLRILFYTPQAN